MSENEVLPGSVIQEMRDRLKRKIESPTEGLETTLSKIRTQNFDLYRLIVGINEKQNTVRLGTIDSFASTEEINTLISMLQAAQYSEENIFFEEYKDTETNSLVSLSFTMLSYDKAKSYNIVDTYFFVTHSEDLILMVRIDPSKKVEKRFSWSVVAGTIPKVETGIAIELLKTAIRIVQKCGTQRTQNIPVKSIVYHPSTSPPIDEKYDELIEELNRGRATCRRARIPTHKISAYSLDHCVKLPDGFIVSVADDLRNRNEEPEIVVYWNGSGFIVSDDYILYLAYRLVRRSHIPCVIIGSFPSSAAKAGKKFGSEILPRPYIFSSNPYLEQNVSDANPEEIVEDYLENLRSTTSSSLLVPRLVSIADEFAGLLADAETAEADLHQYLVRQPVVIDPSASAMYSEVRLGSAYRADLVLHRNYGDVKRTTLVELESPKVALFTKSGRQRAGVTHAIQQVDDWIRWLREFPSQAPDHILPEFPPSGLVVVGRSTRLSSDQVARLEHQNSNRSIQVVTYDMLLNNFEAMIRRLSEG